MTHLEDVFILEENSAKIDLYLSEDGNVFLCCGSILDGHSARQLKNGLMALLSGSFSRACSLEHYEFDLARRTNRGTAAAPRKTTPNLGDL